MGDHGHGKKGKGGGHHEEEHEEHVNHEAWVIPYADVLTLLMALFLVMWAVGSDTEKTELAAESFRRELARGESIFDLGIGSGGSGALPTGGLTILEGAGPAPVRTDLGEAQVAPPSVEIEPGAMPQTLPTVPEIDPIDDEELPSGAIADEDLPGEPVDEDPIPGDPLSEVERIVRTRADGTGVGNAIGFRREDRGLVVTIVTDQVLFEPGQADVRPDGIAILDVVADALTDIPNAVMIEGHTDSRPISTTRFPSNWELSTARATSVLRYMVETREFPRDRLSAAGYADTRPIASGDDPASLAQNRRVEIVVLATAVSG